MSRNRDVLIPVDGHVHLRSCFNTTSLLESAYTNFRRIAEKTSADKAFVGVLFLADAPGDRGFDWLEGTFNQKDIPNAKRGWRVLDTREDCSLYLRSGKEKELIAIAGRQVISREHLEVLAIGTRQGFDKKPIATLIREIAQTGALAVVPWGAGKWVGARGRRMKKLIQDRTLPQYFLGDSANRWSLWPQPVHFRLAKERGIRNIPGSDPLPFPDEVQRLGRFGFMLKGSLDVERPFEDLRAKLFDDAAMIHRFGTGETLFRFIRNQLKMQCRKLIAQ